MDNYSIVLDVWEGQLEINEAELTGNVVGLIVRLNDMNGGHHKDTGFDKQWEEAKNFSPAPYFVYNPWVSGQDNYAWLRASIPSCPAVFIDTEVRKTSLSVSLYGAEYNKFIKLCRSNWKTIIYTGAGFLDALAPWPKDVDYWWAAYPWSMYPNPGIKVTWEQLRTMLDKLVWPPYNSAVSPGLVGMWQCSGDRITVPGSIRPMDISVFKGTQAEYRAWLGYDGQPPALTWEQSITKWARGLGYSGPEPT